MVSSGPGAEEYHSVRAGGFLSGAGHGHAYGVGRVDGLCLGGNALFPVVGWLRALYSKEVYRRASQLDK